MSVFRVAEAPVRRASGYLAPVMVIVVVTWGKPVSIRT